MQLTAEQFGKALVSSGLVTAEELKTLWNGLPATERPRDGAAFAQLLQARGSLNEFQAQELLSGRNSPLVLGDYVLLAKIGAGGMGQVFKAEHRVMKRRVAIKLLPPAMTKDEAAIKRFQREVQAAAKLSHPNIVQAFDASVLKGVSYLVMEHVEGRDLSVLVKERGPLPVEQAVDYTLQVARGLAFAHSEGVIHRDIKPANLLLDKKGVVKILDMGLARFDDGDDGLTGTEQVMGTVDYMSPEQASNTKSADARADIYSLGCTLWYLLTGKKAYEGDTMIERLMAHREQPFPSLVKARDDVPWPLEQAFHKMLAKRPQDRTQTMDEVVTALEPYAGHSPKGGMGSSIGMGGATSPELASFLQAVRTKASGPGTMATSPKTTTGPKSTNVAPVEATAAFTSADSGTDPKSEMLFKGAASPPTAAKPKSQNGGNRGKKPPVKLIAAGIGGLALVMLLGVVVFVRNKDGQDVTQITVPEGGSVTTSTPSAAAANSIKTATALRKPRAPGMTHYERLVSPLHDWTEPERVPAPLDISGAGPNHDAAQVCFLPDGLTMIFAEHFPERTTMRLRMATRSRQDSPWGQAVDLPVKGFVTQPVNPTISADGLTIVFRDSAPDTFGSYDLYQMQRRSIQDPFGKLVHFGPEINSDTEDLSATLAPDGLSMVICSGRPGGVGQKDLWLTKRTSTGAPWAPIEILKEPLNSKFTETCPAYLPDGSGLLFSRGTTLFVSECLPDGGFGTPAQLAIAKPPGRTVMIAPTLLPDGETLFFSARATFRDPSEYWQVRRGPTSLSVAAGSTTTEVNLNRPSAPPLAVTPFNAAQAKAHQEAWAKHLGTTVETVNSVGAKMTLIPPGEFLMGSTADQTAAARKMGEGEKLKPSEYYWKQLPSEMPQHRVAITRPFLIDGDEITVEQFRKFVDATKYTTEAEQFGFGESERTLLDDSIKQSFRGLSWKSSGYSMIDDAPVAQITWNDAVEFCNWLSKSEGFRPVYEKHPTVGWVVMSQEGYRLPTEAEWEYACRAGTTTLFSFGDDVSSLSQYGWYESNSNSKLRQVATKRPNAFGLFDMHGNVREWCQDYYGENFYTGSPLNDPVGYSAGDARVVRGGYCSGPASLCRSAFRHQYSVSSRRNNLGFRIVRGLTVPSSTASLTQPAASGTK